MSTQKSNRQESNTAATNGKSNGTKAIVLVHGGFVDGSGWAGVYNILRNRGYNVAVVCRGTGSCTSGNSIHSEEP